MQLISWKPTTACLIVASLVASVAHAQAMSPNAVLFENVRIFDGKGSALSAPSNVLVQGNKIEQISTAPIPADLHADARIIQGGGRTLMPGLIDAHVHIAFEGIPQQAALFGDIGYLYRNYSGASRGIGGLP